MNNAFRVPLRASGGMPEYHSQTIGPEAGTNVSARLDDSAGRIIGAQATRNAQVDAESWEKFNRGLQTFLQSGNRLYNEYRDKTSRAYVDEALLRAREEMEAWRTDYDQTHKGQNGLQAAADYQKEWNRISEAHLNGLREKGVSGPYEQLANLHLRENGIYYGNQGVAFQQQQDKAFGDNQLKVMEAQLMAEVRRDPDNGTYQGLLLSQFEGMLKRQNPGLDVTPAVQGMQAKMEMERFNVKLAAKDTNGAQQIVNRNQSYSGVGSLAVEHESGGDPGNVSPDTSGSYSYGLFQFNSKRGGTAHSFMPFLKQNHPKLYAALGNGYLKVGSKEFNQVFRDVAHGEMKDEMIKAQQEHAYASYVAPVESKLDGTEFQKEFGNNRGYKEVILSTAIQHGPSGANRILREAWGMVDKNADKQTQLSQLIQSTYQLRGRPGEFKTALAEKKDDASRERFMAGLRGRYAKEAAQAQALAQKGSVLSPTQTMEMQGKIDHLKREQAKEAGLTAQSFSNRLKYGLDTGDFSAAEKNVEDLRGLGFHKEAAELSDRLGLARTAYSALNDVSDLPLVEQAAATHARLDKLVTPDNATAATAMRDDVSKALAAKQAAFVKDPAAYVAALPAMQGEMSTQERVQRSMELQKRMGKGLPYEPRILASEQAKQAKKEYDNLETPASRVAWLGKFVNEYGRYARQALHEMKAPEQVLTMLPVLGVMNEKSMGLALSAIEVNDSDIPGLDKDKKQAAVDAVASNRLMKDVLALQNSFPTNDVLRRFGKGMETMLTNYVKLGGNLDDFDKAFESSTSGNCFLMLPRNTSYSVDDVVDATTAVREDLREKLLADIPMETQQGRIDRANLTGLIDRGVFVSDETGTKVTLIDPQHGRPVHFADGKPLTFDIATIVKAWSEKGNRLRDLKDASAGFGMPGGE